MPGFQSISEKVDAGGLKAKPVKNEWPEEEIESAVKTRFPDREGILSCRFLWENGGIARYRANWVQEKITTFLYSSFLWVRKTADGFVVEERSGICL